MRIVFFGTPQFAIKVLDEINKSRHEIVAVVTQPDKVNGRKNKVTFSPVKSYALENGLNILQFDNISKEGEETIKSLLPDIMVTCAYGQILRQNILDICPIFNVHASLLPKYRGSSPVQWALINGEEKVGVTIMKTELGVDTGDMILQESIQLVGDENSDETLEKLSLIGAKLIVKALDEFENGSIRYIKQQESEATHCRMLKKEDGKIDFSLSAEKVK
ncbi:MAG: methionyl-tRNA formyltransferase, partial [Clostridia bacterium]|nr:methionyl-tRNA formyltransferase [Clostridia bacterium]